MSARSARAFMVATLLWGLLATGCLGPIVIDRYKQGAQLQSTRIQLLDAAPDWVRLRYESRYQGPRVLSQTVEFNPALFGCPEVALFVRDGSGRLRLNPGESHVIPRDAVDTQLLPPGPCEILLLTQQHHQSVSLRAFKSDLEIGAATIEAPRNSWWLAAFPAAVLADAVIIIPATIAWAALYALGENDTATIWTWTP